MLWFRDFLKEISASNVYAFGTGSHACDCPSNPLNEWIGEIQRNFSNWPSFRVKQGEGRPTLHSITRPGVRKSITRSPVQFPASPPPSPSIGKFWAPWKLPQSNACQRAKLSCGNNRFICIPLFCSRALLFATVTERRMLSTHLHFLPTSRLKLMFEAEIGNSHGSFRPSSNCGACKNIICSDFSRPSQRTLQIGSFHALMPSLLRQLRMSKWASAIFHSFRDGKPSDRDFGFGLKSSSNSTANFVSLFPEKLLRSFRSRSSVSLHTNWFGTD